MQYAFCSEPGSRDVNEDSVGAFCEGDTGLFIVADGLGGHGKGDVASKITVETFLKNAGNRAGPLDEQLRLLFSEAQANITSEQKRTGGFSQMKTTACALMMRGKDVMWGHIGDTRLYAFSKHRIVARTLDHSVPQMLVVSREIKEKDIRDHPDRNKLLRVLGIAGESLRYELSKQRRLGKFHAFLLCSDGFWELIFEEEMTDCLKQSTSVDEWLAKMKAIVEKRGSDRAMDNYSAVAVWV